MNIEKMTKIVNEYRNFYLNRNIEIPKSKQLHDMLKMYFEKGEKINLTRQEKEYFKSYTYRTQEQEKEYNEIKEIQRKEREKIMYMNRMTDDYHLMLQGQGGLFD